MLFARAVEHLDGADIADAWPADHGEGTARVGVTTKEIAWHGGGKTLGSVKANAPSARVCAIGRRDRQSSRGSLRFVTQSFISTQLLHRGLIFHASPDECVILTAV